jgi:hypothetical protein
MADDRLNIFDIMGEFDRQKLNTRDRYKDEKLKEYDSFIGYPALRWMSAAQNDIEHLLCLLNVNEINSGFFDLQKHKAMQSKALASTGIGQKTRHVYIKPPENKRTSRLYTLVLTYYPDFDYEDCDDFINKCSPDDIQELATMSGLYEDKKSMKPLLDEFKKYSELR